MGRQELPDHRCAGQDLVGEEAGGGGIVGRHSHLQRDVAPQFLDRIALRVERLQGRQPVREDRFQHRPIDVLLAAEVIKEVRLRHAGTAGDLVDRRAAKTMDREDFECRHQYGAAIDLLNPRARLVGLTARIEIDVQDRPLLPIHLASPPNAFSCGICLDHARMTF